MQETEADEKSGFLHSMTARGEGERGGEGSGLRIIRSRFKS